MEIPLPVGWRNWGDVKNIQERAAESGICCLNQMSYLRIEGKNPGIRDGEWRDSPAQRGVTGLPLALGVPVPGVWESPAPGELWNRAEKTGMGSMG